MENANTSFTDKKSREAGERSAASFRAGNDFPGARGKISPRAITGNRCRRSICRTKRKTTGDNALNELYLAERGEY